MKNVFWRYYSIPDYTILYNTNFKTLKQLILYGKFSCIRVSLEIPLISLLESEELPARRASCVGANSRIDFFIQLFAVFISQHLYHHHRVYEIQRRRMFIWLGPWLNCRSFSCSWKLTVVSIFQFPRSHVAVSLVML